MRHLWASLGLTLALLGCAPAAPEVFGPVIVLHPVPTPPRPRAKPPVAAYAGARLPAVLPVPPVPPDGEPVEVILPTASAGSVIANYHAARALAAAYVAAPGTTVEGLQRVRVLDLAAERAVWLLQHHHPRRQIDADNASSAVSELLEIVK